MDDQIAIAGALMGALRQLENTTSTLEKRQLIQKYDKTIPAFRDMLTFALDPYKRFGIARMPVGGGTLHGTNGWHDIKTFLEDATRKDIPLPKLTTYAFQVADNMHPHVRELFRRVLLKDLRCGVGATLVNSVIPGLIPQFSCQLAELLEPRHIPKLQQLALTERIFGQPKMNGDRSVTIAPNHFTVPEMLSRKGFPQHNYRTIAEAIHQLQRLSWKEGIVFDGEVIVGDFWKTRGTKKLAGNEAEGAVLHIFDAVLYDQWRKAETDVFSARLKLLREAEKTAPWIVSGVLKRVPTMALTDLSQTALDSLRDKLIAGGYEGLIIRLDRGYDFSSSARTCMYKHKVRDTLDCVILEVLPGEEGKKMGEVAARLRIELPNGQECLAGMGKGLKMEALEKLWKYRSKYVGLVGEISYQEKTVNESGEWKLQFPKFTGVIRKDKS